MKKLLIYALAALVLASCAKDDPVAPSAPSPAATDSLTVVAYRNGCGWIRVLSTSGDNLAQGLLGIEYVLHEGDTVVFQGFDQSEIGGTPCPSPWMVRIEDPDAPGTVWGQSVCPQYTFCAVGVTLTQDGLERVLY